MNVDQARVHLVGSLPFGNAEDSFRAVTNALAGYVGWIPDGEFGERLNWTAMLPEFVYPYEDDLVEVVAPPERTLMQPPVSDEPIPGELPGFWTFRIKPGHKLRFNDLIYGRAAVASYQTFRRLRDAGEIAADVRFQVSLPSAHSGIESYFDDHTQWPEAHAAWIDGIGREIDKILAVAPATDLVFQWDCANEFVDLGLGDTRVMNFSPHLTAAEKFERHAGQLGALGALIPSDALLGFHWCYGTWGGWPAVAMQDLDACVRLSNEAVRRISRHVDYIHMPVVPRPDDAFYAPLRNLKIGDTRVFLGMVHPTDTIDDFRRRRDLARKYLPDFGIGWVCGFREVDAHGGRTVLAVHAANAAEL